MKRTKGSQKGFSLVELILIVVAIGLIGGVGYWAYQHNRPQTSDAANGDNQQPTDKPSTDDEQKPAVNYLEIKEWGVKLPLSEDIKDAYYVSSIGSVGEDGITNQIFLGLKSLDNKGCEADGSNHGEDSAIAMIVRVLPTEVDPVSGKLVSQTLPGVTIDNYFYGYHSFANVTKCEAPQATIQAVDAAFKAQKSGITRATE